MIEPGRFSDLGAYAFTRLRHLLEGQAPGGEPLPMSIGEPHHPFPDFVADVIAREVAGFGRYPPNDGTPELLDAIGGWLQRRYGVEMAPENLLVLNGTREGLFAAGQALSPAHKSGQQAAVLMPNPFYQPYLAAARSAGAEPVFLPATRATGSLPDLSAIPADVLARATLFYVCSPSNPQGAVADEEWWRQLITLAERHDFRIIADECYAEIWRDVPPPGALEVSAAMGADPERVLAFHSLSKRSNLPGLRSGFVAGGKRGIAAMRQLRAYGGSPLPLPLQAVAARVWQDEAHVVENRRLYYAKYTLADEIFGHVPGYVPPAGGFFLWLPVEDSESATVKLWRETGVRVVPGAYLGREVDGVNPAARHVRVAMVAPMQDVQRGLRLVADCLYG